MIYYIIIINRDICTGKISYGFFELCHRIFFYVPHFHPSTESLALRLSSHRSLSSSNEPQRKDVFSSSIRSAAGSTTSQGYRPTRKIGEQAMKTLLRNLLFAKVTLTLLFCTHIGQRWRSVAPRKISNV